MRIRRRLEIGLALGADAMTAVVRHRGVVQRVIAPVALPAEPEDATAALVNALRMVDAQLGAALGFKVRAVDVNVVLLPPLADARFVALPPVKQSEAHAVIQRDVARYFVGATSPRAVAVQPAAEGFLAAAAPVSLLESIRGAVRAMGWMPQRVVAAHGAWLHAGSDSDRCAIVAVLGEAAHVLVRDGGRPVSLRRMPALMTGEVVEAAGRPSGRFIVLGDQGAGERLARAFRAARWNAGDESAGTAEECALLHAHRSRLELVAPSQEAERARKARLTAVRMGMAAAVLLMLAGLVQLWGVRRELDQVRARRAALRAEVAPLLVLRDSIQRLSDQARGLRELEATAPLWTRALFDLALLLPEDTHLTSLQATADTLIIEAAGTRAGEAMQALRRAGSLGDIRMLGTVQRELEDGEIAVERFRLRALLNPLPPERSEPVERNAARATVATSSSRAAGKQP